MSNPTSKPEHQDTPFPTREDHPRQGEEALDNALEESFPASDPDSVSPDKSSPAKAPPAEHGKTAEQKPDEHKEQTLDEGVEESFPASDPVSISTKKTKDSDS